MYLFDSIVENEFKKIDRWGVEVIYKRKKTLHHFECNNCKKEFVRERNGKLRESYIHFCPDCPNYSLAQKETSKIRLKKSKEIGVKIDRGYREIFVGPDYPYRKNINWIREHIYVMEQHIKKRIPKGMVVHHIDGDKQNNKLENLLLCSVSDHNNCHAKIEKIVFDLYKKGIVGFDSKSMCYYLKNLS